MDSPFYSTAEVIKILGICKTTACKLMKQWRSELAEQGYYGGQRGQISKAYVDSKLYGKDYTNEKICSKVSN